MYNTQPYCIIHKHYIDIKVALDIKAPRTTMGYLVVFGCLLLPFGCLLLPLATGLSNT